MAETEESKSFECSDKQREDDNKDYEVRLNKESDEDPNSLLWKLLKLRKHVYEVEKILKSLEEKKQEDKLDKNKILSPYLQINSNLYSSTDSITSLLEQEREEDEEDEYEKVPIHCVPIRADVRTMDWKKLGKMAQFDVIVMDPPWQLASANPTRGVAIGYAQLSDGQIEEMPIHEIQKEGFIFIWVINAKYIFTLEMMKKWGYKFVDALDWVKRTVNRRLAPGHGYYLQHAKETCLVGVKGEPKYNNQIKLSDVIWSNRRGQSQKPEEIYQLIEQLVPNGKYLEIFGRKNNLRDYWVTIGNEL